MSKEAKKYYIPLLKTEQASTGYIEFYRDYQLTEVSEEVYRAYYQPIWRTWKRAKRNGSCSGEDWKRCLGDCVGCTRCNYANTPLSMDMPIGDSEEMTVADTVEDPSALTDTALIESAALEELLTALQEIDPDGRRIGELLLEGKSRKVITGKDTRWSYANIWEPKAINGGTPKYSVSLIIPKSDTVTVAKIKAAIEAAYQEGESKLKGNGRSVPPLSAIKNPLRDGDAERPDDPAYANAYFVNANSSTAPGIIDADRNEILTHAEVYSGVYGRASVNFYAFNSNGNRGIACGLNNLQKIRDGEPLGGKASAESDFATDEDDDFLA